jgi:hypothetical protein
LKDQILKILIAALLLLTTPILVEAATAPDFGETKMLGDWEVGCDNARNCEAISLSSDGGDDEARLDFILSRDYGPYGAPKLVIWTKLSRDARASVRGIGVDGVRIVAVTFGRGEDVTLSPVQSLKVARAMGKGEEISLMDGRGRKLASASLAGMADTLGYMDQVQQRSGTTSALIRLGPQAATSMAIPPLAPIAPLRRWTPSTLPATKLPLAKLQELMAGHPCRRGELASLPPEPTYIRLDDRDTLLILDPACGGYNPEEVTFILDDKGQTRPVPFGPSPFQSDDGSTLTPNLRWDKKEGRLISSGKTRSLGDCGQILEFVWTLERQFELARYRSLISCRGRYDYITTYQRPVRTMVRPIASRVSPPK